MLKSIRLVNWRSHKDSVLEFRSGTNLLIGIMGAGKSSILEGISYALFGTFPALERRKLKLENLMRFNEANSKVVLEFDWEDETYKIEREIERTKRGTTTTAEVFKNNLLVEHGTFAVTTFIENLTNVDYDLFTRAIYSEQNNIEYFLNLDPRRRKQEIDTLLGLDKFETARSNIVTVIGKFRTKKKTLEERFSKEKLAEIEFKEKEQLQKISSAEVKLRELLVALDENQKQLALLLESFNSMKAQKEKFESLEKQSIFLSAECTSIEKQIIPIPEMAIESAKEKLIYLQKQKEQHSLSLRSLDQKISDLSKEAGSISANLKTGAESNSRCHNMRKELAALLDDRTIETLKAEQKEVSQTLLSSKSELTSLKQQIEELQELLVKLKADLSKCPLCSSNLTDQSISHIKEERAELISQKEKRIGELSSLVAQNQKQNELLEEKIRKATSLSENLSSIAPVDLEKMKSHALELEKQSTILLSEKRILVETTDVLGKESEKLRLEVSKYEDILKKTKLLEETSKKLAEVKSQLSHLLFDKEAFESIRVKTESAKLDLEKLNSSKTMLETEQRITKDHLKSISEELNLLRTISLDIQNLYELEDQLLIYKNALLETQTSLRSSLTDAINGAMNEIWPIFYPYNNYKALRLSVSEKDYLFEVNDGAWKSLDIIASGGERASAALTLRVALAMVLTPKLSWLILDEPTHNLDSQAVEMLSSALQFKVPEVVKQTFVITHDEAFMGSDFASNYRLTRDKENNGETKVESV
ncbi:SMC family ATPase [Candidatus Micrarchaeota archaeon]|nr:SMC family ATPase [Candidatus Micrarchaeota archaeon]